MGASADVQIELSDVDKRKRVFVNKEVGLKDLFPAALGEDADNIGNEPGDERLPLYFDGENVSGKVSACIGRTNCTQQYKRRGILIGTYSA